MSGQPNHGSPGRTSDHSDIANGTEDTVDTGGDEPVLRASDIAVAYGGVSVLEDVSLALDPGTVTTLIGPNGSGKTTLIRVLAGLESPDAGFVTVDAEADRPIGYHPQRPTFRPNETVREVMTYYADIVGDETPVEDRLTDVGIAAVADRRIDALSGGMVRLLAVAQATIGDPPVVLLDEPTSDLDPDMSAAIATVIANLADRGAAVLAVTHDLIAVETIADDVILLDHGSVKFQGPPSSILDRAGTDDLPAAFSALTRGETATRAVRAGVDGQRPDSDARGPEPTDNPGGDGESGTGDEDARDPRTGGPP